MAIIKTVGFDEFKRDFDVRKDNFSYYGLKVLYEHLENLSEDMGKNIELDVIALCCEYTEFESIGEYNNDYEEVENIEEIEAFTIVIRIDNDSFIIQNY